MAEELDYHETQDLVHDYDHLEMEDAEKDVDEFLAETYEELSDDMVTYWNANEKVGRGRQGTKWRVKYKEALGRRDQVEQVYSELQERDFINHDQPIDELLS